MSADSVVHATEVLDGAAAAWTVLSAGFGRVPEAGFVERLRSPEQLQHWPLRRPDTVRGTQLLAESGQRPETLAEIRADHQRLLVGPDRLPAPPWESVWTSREGLVFEADTMAVRAAYRRFGLQTPHLNREPDDHVAIECAFLAQLCLSALDELDAGEDPGRFVDGYRDFVTGHVTRWMPPFFERVEEHAGTAFYRGLAALGAGTVGHEADRLSQDHAAQGRAQ